MSAPAKLADLLLSSAAIVQPPVPVYDLLAERAVVKFDILPMRFDGLLVRKVGERPQVFVRSDVSDTRQRFTCGHELGHLVVPWHHGSIACMVEDPYDSDSPAVQMEREANEFASRLLLPTAWFADRLNVDPGDLANSLAECASDANVSHAACVMAMRRSVDHAAQAVIINQSRVEVAAQTGGWHGTSLGPWSENPLALLEKESSEISRTSIGGGRVLYVGVFEFRCSGDVPSVDSRGVLRGILAELYCDEDERKIMSARVNGVVGSANNRVQVADPVAIEAALVQRFRNREYRELTSHPKFPDFLRAKAHELAEKKNNA
jgi:Zn-dependent peptidase ImmA (M78 family)